MNESILEFLNELKNNNNREWFQKNREHYQRAKDEMDLFVNGLIPYIRDFDPSIDLITAKDCTFRIYRDIRFSPNKSPYKTNMGAYIARGGKNSAMAGYYVHFEPGASFLAGGIYMPQPEVLKIVRQEIFYHFDEFNQIINDGKFRKLFGQIDDENKMKTGPRDFPKDFHGIEFLKFRNYAVAHQASDEQVISTFYLDYARKVFLTLHPLNAFFNRLFV